MTRARARIGCAGWALSAEQRPLFPPGGSHLERYARVFDAVEINSSFYRPHRPATYRRWAAAVPESFRFTVKMPRGITHVARLRDARDRLERFLEEVLHLGDRLGALLVQLPPGLAFEEETARGFVSLLRGLHAGRIAWEARHPGWFGREAVALLRKADIATVAADPAVVEAAARPGGSAEFAYYRLHGSPRMYRSAYSPEFLRALAGRLKTSGTDAYCIFDNTAEGAAVRDALALSALLAENAANR